MSSPSPVVLTIAMTLTLVFTWLATGIVRRYALGRNMLDIPNTRSSHSLPTARGGGLAIVASFLAWGLVLGALRMLDASATIAVFGGGAVISLIGYLDDRKPVTPSIRFAVHLAVALSTVFLVGGLPEISLRMLGLHGGLAGGVVGVVLLIWATNLFNFMDGIDGIAGSEAAFITAAGAILNWRHHGDPGLSISMLALGASTCGFLIWNWPPARIFMGDAGSGFLGFSLGSLGLLASRGGAVPIEAWVILGGVFVVDATLTLLRRVARGERWFEAHRMHAYQHLSKRWNSHLAVTSVAALINLFWLLPWACLASEFPARAPWILAAALLPLGVAMLAVGAGSREVQGSER